MRARYHYKNHIFILFSVALLVLLLGCEMSETKPEHLNQLLLETRKVVLKELNSYQSEMAAARDKVWPNLVASIGKSLAAGSVTAVTFNFIAGPGCVLAGSILASAMSMLKGLLDIRTEMNKAKRSASPSVAYLSRLVELK